VAYGDGSYGVNGTIVIAPLEFGPYKVEQQAFLDVNQISLTGITEYGIDGLLGLGFNGTQASNIDRKIRTTYGATATWGQPFLTNVFAQNTSSPNFIAIDLARTDDLEDTSGGSFDIGEYDSRYVAIQEAPKLPQFPAGSDSWQTLLDGIQVNGKDITMTSGVRGAPNGKAVAALDTGTPTSAFTTKVVNQIYGSVTGAVFISNDYGWALPCNATPDVEFSFGGQSFTMHPLDLSTPYEVTIDGTNYTTCLSSFITIDGWSDVYDYLLGDSFLRNTYTVYDFGDYDANAELTGTPYMQLLAETNYSTAAVEAVTARAKTLAGMAPELAPSDLLNIIQGSGTNTNATGTGSAIDFSPSGLAAQWSSSDMKKYALIIIGLLGANIVIGLVLLVFGVLGCVKRSARVGARSRSNPQYIPVPDKMGEGGQQTYTGYNGGRYDT
jgi:saccharopepsin